MSDAEDVFADIGQYIVDTVTSEEFLQAVFDVAATVALGVGINAISGNKRPSTSNERLKFNVRIPEPPRWIIAGETLVGGSALFGEFDEDGNFWYVIVHSDSEVTNLNDITYYCDNEQITVDPTTHEVLTAAFRLDDHQDTVENDGDWNPFMWVWTTTYTSTDPTPPGITELMTALPTKWTSDHKLVGTTYTVIKMGAVEAANRHKLYHWRGPFQMGEPSVSILGKWSRAYDPREVDHTLGTPATYEFSTNPVIQWAWFRTHRYGRNKSNDSINWDKIAEQADLCDETVIGDYGTQPRYTCAVAIPDDRIRSEAEQDILMCMDAQLMFDTDGKCWPRVGYYEAPTVTFTRNRDIVAMASLETQSAENETQGVIVRYTEPEAKYTIQPSAPWYNPAYYVPGEKASFLTIDAPSCYNHNQAMRLAKAFGQRLQPLQRLAPTVSLRGLRAKRERIIELRYDDVFTGTYEIYAPVRIDANGIVCNMTVVPIGADRWDLLEGEEKSKPVIDDVEGIGPPAAPAGVAYSYIDGRIRATFTAPTRKDVVYEFQYVLTSDIGTDQWLDFSTNMTDLIADSGAITANTSYSLRYRSVAPSGAKSAYNTPSTFNTNVALPPVQSFNVTGGIGANTITWRNPADIRHDHIDLYRATSAVFGSATMVHTQTGGPSQDQDYTDTLALGTYYYWIICYTSGGAISSTTTGPLSGVVI